MSEYIVLVNDSDEAIGLEEKLAVHQAGLLHRAFSVFMINPANTRMFLQQRASGKYHSAGLWTNACCSHLREGETFDSAIQRRMQEELGVQSEYRHLFDFRYRAEFANGLIEHEIDHVYLTEYDGAITPDPDEIDEYRWIAFDDLDAWIQRSPEAFTPWFLIAYPRVRTMIDSQSSIKQ